MDKDEYFETMDKLAEIVLNLQASRVWKIMGEMEDEDSKKCYADICGRLGDPMEFLNLYTNRFEYWSAKLKKKYDRLSKKEQDDWTKEYFEKRSVESKLAQVEADKQAEGESANQTEKSV